MSSKPKSSLLPVYFVLFLDNFGFAVIFATFGPLFQNADYGMVTAQMSSAVRNSMTGKPLV